ncbi:hypothetical protein B9Z55_010844 [Caenorhabditis nigoni]|uniref:Sdz-33 F-box domain-containing protein n=1 Tax=Caenorhabditis nigoni TaxID=1611254 RepID=A0A2G5UHI9_9PELO|nr:hypothetical protein B9Z55_010844 [Caenorhabditis nigoni]
MTEIRFPFLSLPIDLGVKVMKTMSLHEQTAYSLASKKSYSKIKSLRLPIPKVLIRIHGELFGFMEISLAAKDITDGEISFKLQSQRSDGMITSLDDIPVNLEVSKTLFSPFGHKLFDLSNQGMCFGEWIQHICSIFQGKHYGAEFTIGMSQLNIQSLRNILPELRSVQLKCSRSGRNQQGVLYAQSILKAFLPDVENVSLFSVPLHESLSVQHIGLTNLKMLRIYGNRKLKLDDLISLNVKNFRIDTDQTTLRDLNRFFKLWMKGSNPKLKKLSIYLRNGNNSDWSVLLNGFQTEESEDAQVKNVTIQNCFGVSARIQIRVGGTYVIVELTVSNYKTKLWFLNLI